MTTSHHKETDYSFYRYERGVRGASPLHSESVLLPLSGALSGSEHAPPGAPTGASAPTNQQQHRLLNGGSRMPSRFLSNPEAVKENIRPTSTSRSISRSSREFPMQSPSPSKQGPVFAPPRKDMSGKEREIHNAATKIQAAWRGFRVRELDRRVHRAREAAFRAGVRQHLRHLHQQLELYHECYQEERRARLMQQEALRILVSQVTELRTWKDSQPDPAETLASLGRLSPQERTLRLEGTCGALEEHIEKMNASLEALRATLATEAARALEQARGRLARVPRAGCPLPPDNLRLLSEGHDWVEIGWEPSRVVDESGELSDTVILGYKIIVDGAEHSMVFDSKTEVLVARLDLSVSHRITVRAAADLGDSYCATPELKVGGALASQDVEEQEDEESETEQMAAALERTMQLVASQSDSIPAETPDLPSVTPERQDSTPQQRHATPERRDATPERRDATPERRDATPERRDATPERRDATYRLQQTPDLSDATSAAARDVIAAELTVVTPVSTEDVEDQIAQEPTSRGPSTDSSDIGSTEL